MPRLFWRRLSPFHSLLGFLTFLLRTLKLSPSHWNILPLELVVPSISVHSSCHSYMPFRGRVPEHTLLCTSHQASLALSFLRLQRGLLLLLL